MGNKDHRTCYRCNGNMFLDIENDGCWMLYCLQCGYRRYLDIRNSYYQSIPEIEDTLRMIPVISALGK